MRFSLMIDFGRTSPDESMDEVMANVLELVQMADAGGIDAVYCGEHHGIEMTIAPNPFMVLATWAQHVKRIRLGTAVVCAPYWHPIRLAGEAALLDCISGGRLELGIGRGAFPYEFNRMGGGMQPEVARQYLWELVPALKGLWAGDYAHAGQRWSFPETTTTPRPVQQPHPPLWIAARHPELFDFAVQQRTGVMATPLHWPFEEVISLRERLDAAVQRDGGEFMPKLMVLRDACVYDEGTDWREPTRHVREAAGYFETLFSNVGTVSHGFPERADLSRLDGEHYSEEAVWENHVFGTPDEVIAKLRRYEEAGVDSFLYGAGWKAPHELKKRSLELFIDEVMPAFASDRAGAGRR
jgi:alkanesulfonate monooxygenase SsuD/methylene tetrahydromethanopterin reductase-like flavin-dependent oxidoreductase (luciferase family)